MKRTHLQKNGRCVYKPDYKIRNDENADVHLHFIDVDFETCFFKTFVEDTVS